MLSGRFVLAAAASMIHVRAQIGSFGRCGDDTFYGYLPKASHKKADKICEQLRKRVELMSWHNLAPDLRVSCTFGYAELYANEHPHDWIVRAARGLLEGKKKGGNVVTQGPAFVGKKFHKAKRKHLSGNYRVDSDIQEAKDVEAITFSLRDYFS